MPKLPTLRWRPAPAGRAERLASWLKAWRWEQHLRRESAEYATPFHPAPRRLWATNPELEDLIKDFDKGLQVGQIRLLDPLIFEETRRPLYVALISEWDEDSFVTAPFGPFGDPATTTEWLTGRQTSALRVLCLWNVRTLPNEILNRSWLVDDLTQAELDDAWTVFRHASTGVDLEDRLLAKVGCPITHPRDPRLDYQVEEVRLFTTVPEYVEHRLELEPSGKNNIIDFPSPWNVPEESEEIVLAARSLEAAPLEFAKYAIGGTRLFLRLLTQTDARQVEICVLDHEGNPSVELDGAQFVPGKREAVRIEHGRAICSRSGVLSGFRFLRADGTPVNLTRLE